MRPTSRREFLRATSGATAGDRNAGARILPAVDAISTLSPCRMPSRSAVRVLISTHTLHIAVVTESGSS